MTDTTVNDTNQMPAAASAATAEPIATPASAKHRRTMFGHGIRMGWRLAKIAMLSGIVLGSSDIALKSGYASYEAATTSTEASLLSRLGDAYIAGVKTAWNHDYYKVDPAYRYHVTRDTTKGGIARSVLSGVQDVGNFGLQILNVGETVVITAPAGTLAGWKVPADISLAPQPQ